MKNSSVIIGIVLIAVLVLASTAIVFLPASLHLGNSQQVEFKIEKGDGLSKIAEELASRGLIRSTFLFKSYATLLGQNGNLKAGRYQLSDAMSISDLVHVFSEGLYESDDISVTIPEGSNINDIDNIFAKSGLTKAGDFLKVDTVEQEGYFFPDTYRFAPGTNISLILQRLRENFGIKTTAVFRSRDLAAGDVYRSVIIGSILEKEVQTPTDMALVAGIIFKRLELQIPLQIDATVAYGVCHKSFLLGRHCEVTQVNLIDAIRKDDKYNTYRNTGLLSGPISNPGLNAINAALHPQTSDYLYYLTDKEGKVHYGRTAAEHAENRQKYLNR